MVVAGADLQGGLYPPPLLPKVPLKSKEKDEKKREKR